MYRACLLGPIRAMDVQPVNATQVLKCVEADSSFFSGAPNPLNRMMCNFHTWRNPLLRFGQRRRNGFSSILRTSLTPFWNHAPSAVAPASAGLISASAVSSAQAQKNQAVRGFAAPPLTTRLTPSAVSAVPARVATVMASPNSSQAIRAVVGGTR